MAVSSAQNLSKTLPGLEDTLHKYGGHGFPRVQKVRQDLLDSLPAICPERALLITESYKQTEGEPYVLRKAKALDAILSNMSIYIEDGQLIVGNQASSQRAAPIFPEYSIDWLIDELDKFEVRGMKADRSDGTNALSYLALRAMDLNRLPEPNLSVRYWAGTPRPLLEESARLIREGFGMPSLFADETVIPAMMSTGLSEEVARDYASMGCVEVAIPGRWGHRATGMTYMNFGKILELVLNNGVEPVTGIQLISANGKAGRDVDFKSYDEVWQAWKKFLKFYTDLAVESDYLCDRSLRRHDADPFGSALVDKSIERGKTLKNGGGEFDFVSQSNIGTSVIGDGLAVLKKLVFEDQSVTLKELKEALDANWQGEKNQKIRRLALAVPKFGNDNDYVDKLVADVYESYLELLPDYKNERFGDGPFGCGYTMGTSNISSYVPSGMDVGATPDGRYAGKPLNEGASPCLGADRLGPTAVVKSVSKLPNKRMAGGQLLNMKFSPGVLAGQDNLDKFVSFIEANRLLGNFHIQFNVVDTAELRDAKLHPERHQNLMVRVAGYCALFTELIPEVQDAIIERTEQQAW